MKMHIGSGSVYLEGWTNVDVPGPRTFLAELRKDLVERWKTTDDAYYARHGDKTQDSLRAGPLDQEYVCDTFGSFADIPAPAWTVDEILARHSFEHLSITEARKALSEVDGVLKEGGLLRLDVPDHEATMQKFRETGDEFYMRHLLGPRRTDHGFHMMSYTRDRLKALVEEFNFIYIGEEPNIHFYPAFCLRFVKPGPRAPRDYVALPAIADHWKVLDVGPGSYPLLRADVFVDRNFDHLKPMQEHGRGTVIGDLMSGLPGIADKTFDYAWCSHVLEHVDDPAACARTLSRIAHRGTVVLPSAIKEAMFNFEEAEHKWLILPSPVDGGSPVFVRHNSEYMAKAKDASVQKITSRLFRTGPNRNGDEQRYLRKWFYNNEAVLDVVVHWEGEFKLQVIG